MTHRWYYKVAGGHVHVRVFFGRAGGTLAKCGDLTYRIEEWSFVCWHCEQANIELIEE